MTTVLKIEGMMCGHCAARVTKALEQLEGISTVQVELNNKQAVIEHNGVDYDVMKNAVEDSGFEVIG